MSKPLPWGGRVAALLFLPVGLLPLVWTRQAPVAPVRSPRFHDWTTRHAIYPQFGTSRTLEAARNDPRALFRWREVDQRQQAPRFIPPSQMREHLWFRFRRGPFPFPVRGSAGIHADWSISLGVGATAPAQFPAKFSFDTTAAPDCINDFVVFPVNVAGSGAQPNIVAFNALYSGTAGGNGTCNRAGGPNATDNKTSATVLWSYNVHAVASGAPVPTSPVLSLDGKKVAFVESGGGAGHFHVLAWRSGDTGSTNKQTVTSPVAITSWTASAPVAGSGTASETPFGASTDTLSSPYIDYSNDIAYVGNDAGVLFRIKNVFCTLASCANAAPSIDMAWGTSGSVTVCAGRLTAPVQDFLTGNIYVGCADGKLYGLSSAGTPLPIPSIAVGNASATGGIVDPPVVDGVNGLVYAVSGTGAAPNTTSAVLVQAPRTLSGPRFSLVGPSGKFNLHTPAFNDPYFTSATSTTWLIYVGAYATVGGGATDLVMYAAAFDAGRNLAAGAAAHNFDFGTIEGEYSPLTEFKNVNTDRLFFGLLHPSATALNLGAFPINTFPTAVPPGVGQGNGPTGMVVDNASGSAQASSIYFGVQGSNTAVKLTQANLN
jgi:hypothetical protein